MYHLGQGGGVPSGLTPKKNTYFFCVSSQTDAPDAINCLMTNPKNCRKKKNSPFVFQTNNCKIIEWLVEQKRVEDEEMRFIIENIDNMEAILRKVT